MFKCVSVGGGNLTQLQRLPKGMIHSNILALCCLLVHTLHPGLTLNQVPQMLIWGFFSPCASDEKLNIFSAESFHILMFTHNFKYFMVSYPDKVTLVITFY